MGRVIDVFDEGYIDREPHFGSAEACPNGHITTCVIEVEPAKSSKFCGRCGEQTTRSCSACGGAVQGAYFEPEYGYRVEDYRLPRHCRECGAPFEWTKRLVAAAAEVVRESGEVPASEVDRFESDLSELAKESAKTPAAISRTRTLLGRLSAGVRKMAYDIIVQVASTVISGQRKLPG